MSSNHRFEIIATQQEKKKYIRDKINKLDSLSRNLTSSRNTVEVLKILDNLSTIGITNQEESDINRILKSNSNGYLTFGSRIPSYKYFMETPKESFKLMKNYSNQQVKSPMYISNPMNPRMNQRLQINKETFKKQNLQKFPGASVGGPVKEKTRDQLRVDEMLEQFRMKNQLTKQENKKNKQLQQQKQ